MVECMLLKKFRDNARKLTEMYTFKDLQRELKARGLRASGKKQELKDRLEASLAQELSSIAAKNAEINTNICINDCVTQECMIKELPEAITAPAVTGAAVASVTAPTTWKIIPESNSLSSISSGLVDSEGPKSAPESLPYPSAGNAELRPAETTNAPSSCLSEARAHQAGVQDFEQEGQHKKERECTMNEDAVRRVAAIKRREEAEKRGQFQEKDQCRVDKAACEISRETPIVELPASIHQNTLIPVLTGTKSLTPGPDIREEPHKSLPKAMLKPLSPIDTYEISDREESTDDDEDNEDRRHKHVPAWASGTNLREALRAQANSDPSAVFLVGASSCDLKNIFKTDRAFKKRTSSQNWGMDLSTQIERQKYRAEMGFTPPK
jgi:hypothetical protein